MRECLAKFGIHRGLIAAAACCWRKESEPGAADRGKPARSMVRHADRIDALRREKLQATMNLSLIRLQCHAVEHEAGR